MLVHAKSSDNLLRVQQEQGEEGLRTPKVDRKVDRNQNKDGLTIKVKKIGGNSRMRMHKCVSCAKCISHDQNHIINKLVSDKHIRETALTMFDNEVKQPPQTA